MINSYNLAKIEAVLQRLEILEQDRIWVPQNGLSLYPMTSSIEGVEPDGENVLLLEAMSPEHLKHVVSYLERWSLNRDLYLVYLEWKLLFSSEEFSAEKLDQVMNYQPGQETWSYEELSKQWLHSTPLVKRIKELTNN